MSDLGELRTLITTLANQSVGRLEGNLDTLMDAYRQVLAKPGSSRTASIGWLTIHAQMILGSDLTAKLLAVAIARLADRDEMDKIGGPR